MGSWLRAGRVLAVVSVGLVVAMQAANRQWFPPPVSMSQYGVGRWGWIFSLWVLTLSLSPICTQRGTPRRSRLSLALLLTGMLGTVTMAIVRTDAGGAQVSLNAKVHMIGSIFCLAFLPLGMLAGMWSLGRRWRWIAIGWTALVAVSMALLLFAAAGYDTAGMGSNRSWAFWQTIGVLCCFGMVVTFAAAAARTVATRMSDHTSRERPPAGVRLVE